MVLSCGSGENETPIAVLEGFTGKCTVNACIFAAEARANGRFERMVRGAGLEKVNVDAPEDECWMATSAPADTNLSAVVLIARRSFI